MDSKNGGVLRYLTKSCLGKLSYPVIALLVIAMFLGCKPLFVEPPIFDMQAIVAVGEDTSNWRQTVTGIWGDATAQFEGEDDVRGGYLILYQENQEVKGISTTGNSIWSGVFQNGELIANYTFGIDSSKSFPSNGI